MDLIRNCSEARPHIPAYQDGELAEDRAAPLRRHLLECQACREVAQNETSLKRWFEPQPVVPVPAGFAANVARRAFAGAVPEEAPAELTPFQAPATPGRTSGGGALEGTLLPFILRLTAAAAIILIVLSVALRRESLPHSGELDAQTITETIDFLTAHQRATAGQVPMEDAAAEGLELEETQAENAQEEVGSEDER